MPSWRVAPSGTSSATYSPIRRSTSPIGPTGCSYGGTSHSTARSICETWMKLSPSVRGIAALNWTMTGPGGADRGVHRLDRGPERAEAVGVGRGRVDEHRVERRAAAVEQARDVRQEGRDVVGPTLGDGLPRVRPDEQRPMAEMRRHLGRQVRPGPLAVEVDDADVRQLGRPRHERVEQDRRRRGGALEVELLTGGDPGDGLGGRDDAHGPRVYAAARAGPRGPSRDGRALRRFSSTAATVRPRRIARSAATNGASHDPDPASSSPLVAVVVAIGIGGYIAYDQVLRGDSAAALALPPPRRSTADRGRARARRPAPARRQLVRRRRRRDLERRGTAASPAIASASSSPTCRPRATRSAGPTQVTGSITLDDVRRDRRPLTAGTLTVDTTSITSDKPQRDDRLRSRGPPDRHLPDGDVQADRAGRDPGGGPRRDARRT